MRLSPRQILQHMEVPLKGVDHPWRDANGLFLLGCLEPVRITLIAQQIRALNLVYALICERRIQRGSRITVLGAGAAGLAAARAASHFGCEVTVLEQRACPMSVFCPTNDGNRRRYVHPNLDRWPEEGCFVDKADLPFFKWKAGDPHSIKQAIMEELKGHPGIRVYVNVRATIRPTIQEKWEVDFTGSLWNFDKDSRYPTGHEDAQTEKADLAFLSLGFGFDGKSNFQGPSQLHTKGYWENDEGVWGELCRGNARSNPLLISGDGDGALIDAVCACLARFSSIPISDHKEHEAAVNILRNWDILPELKDELLKIEELIRKGRMSASELKYAYDDLLRIKGARESLGNLDKKLGLSGNSGRNGEVILATPTFDLFQPRTFAINRFLVWRCNATGHLRHRKGKLVVTGKSLRLFDDRPDGIGGSDDLNFETHCIIRHGAVKAFRSQYEAIADICEKKIAPKNELDQTRIPFWPQGFYEGIDCRKAEELYKTTCGQNTACHPLQGSPSDPIQISEITVAILTRRDKAFEEVTESTFEITIKFASDYCGSALYLEHQITPSLPFNLRVVKYPGGENGPFLKILRLHGEQPWAVAYEISKWKRDEELTYVLQGSPCGLIGLPDAVGFPIYSDMKVDKLTVRVSFEHLAPVIENFGGPLMKSYCPSIRRFQYEDGEPRTCEKSPADLSSELANLIVPGKRANSELLNFSYTWSASELKEGYFYGMDWDALIPTN